jgi:hypothetical protein
MLAAKHGAFFSPLEIRMRVMHGSGLLAQRGLATARQTRRLVKLDANEDQSILVWSILSDFQL